MSERFYFLFKSFKIIGRCKCGIQRLNGKHCFKEVIFKNIASKMFLCSFFIILDMFFAQFFFFLHLL